MNRKLFFIRTPALFWNSDEPGPLLAPNTISHSNAKAPLPWFALFPCESFPFFLHPDTVAGNLSADPEILKGKRVVVGEFAERDIALGAQRWEEVPLPKTLQ